MKENRLKSMALNAIAFDVETHLIQPGLLAPPLVLGSAAEGETGKVSSQLLDKQMCRNLFRAILETPAMVICGANIVYDFLVMATDFASRGEDIMPAVFAMYDPERKIIRGDCDGRVFEIQLAESLHAIAQGHLGKYAASGKPIINKKTGRPGRYSLDTVTSEVLGREDAKANDRFRLSYAEFDNVPLGLLPFEARQYPVDDAVNTLEVALAQAGHLPSANQHDWQPQPEGMTCANCKLPLLQNTPANCMVKKPRRNLHDLSRQAYAAWALHLGASWGFNIPQDAVDALEDRYTDAIEATAEPFREAGITRADGSEDQKVLKALVATAYGSSGICPACFHTKDKRGMPWPGKVPSEATEGRTYVNCKTCDGTALVVSPETPRTLGGGIGKSRDVLQESGDELLMAYGDQEGQKILSTYVPLLRSGRACNVCGKTGAGKEPHKEWCTAPNGEAGYRDVPVTLSPNALVETGRCSYERGVHGLPRRGGVRECVVARDGFVFSSEDYTAGELVTHAWSCLKLVGYSKLGEALNAGLDAHLALAGTMLNKTYEEMLVLKKAKDPTASDNRQAAKGANFGFPGGMAELTFVLRKRADTDLFTPCANGNIEHNGVRGYKGMRPCVLMGGADKCGAVKITKYNRKSCSPVCPVCVEYAKKLREFWFQQWPENNPTNGYFAIIKKLVDQNGPGGTPEITHHQSKRIRGGVGFCDGANGLFQGLLSDAMKNAFCAIVRECYDKTAIVVDSEHMQSQFTGNTPLYGSRAIMLAHDEAIMEHPESVAHEAATRVSEIMVEALRFMCPEMAPAVKAEPCLMRKLYKSAEPVYRDGRLIPWEPS